MERISAVIQGKLDSTGKLGGDVQAYWDGYNDALRWCHGRAVGIETAYPAETTAPRTIKTNQVKFGMRVRVTMKNDKYTQVIVGNVYTVNSNGFQIDGFGTVWHSSSTIVEVLSEARKEIVDTHDRLKAVFPSQQIGLTEVHRFLAAGEGER